MIKSQGINCRISKVNQQLQRLACLIQDDCNLQSKTKAALKQLKEAQSSQEQINYYEVESIGTGYKYLNSNKIDSNCYDEKQSDGIQSSAKYGLISNGTLKRSKLQEMGSQMQLITTNNDSRFIDATIKKFRPIQSQSKKKKQSQDKMKENSKLKNSKSENKMFMNCKTDLVKKNNKKQEKDVKKSIQQTNHQQKGVINKKIKTTLNVKGNQQNRLNQSLKMHINLKKYVNMKIVDLNIQKQQCQKQAEYLKSVMKIQQQQNLQSLTQCVGMSSEQSILLVFMIRLVVNFFSQFFNQKIVNSDECTCQQLLTVLKKKKYLIKYMLKLPQILKTDNTLCEQQCRKLFDQKHFLEHRIQSSHKTLLSDPLYIFINCLHDYISFLINNNVVKQTKRKILPIDFHSERSGKGKNNSNAHAGVMNINIINKQLTQATIEQRQRQYDSDRKSDRKGRKQMTKVINNYQTFTNINIHNQKNGLNTKPTLKSINVQNVLSPKGKITKQYHHNHQKIHNLK